MSSNNGLINWPQILTLHRPCILFLLYKLSTLCSYAYFLYAYAYIRISRQLNTIDKTCNIYTKHTAVNNNASNDAMHSTWPSISSEMNKPELQPIVGLKIPINCSYFWFGNWKLLNIQHKRHIMTPTVFGKTYKLFHCNIYIYMYIHFYLQSL